MTSYPAWTPAPRPGLVPLRPLGFGEILGRSFAALRAAPRVLLGFAMTTQLASSLVLTAVVSAVGITAFLRLENVPPDSEDFTTILLGSTALVAVVAIVLSIAVGFLSVVVQGVIVQEVSRGVLGERQTLGTLWRAVRPAIGRLVLFTALLAAATLVGVGLATAVAVGLGLLAVGAGVAAGVLAVLAGIVVSAWLTVRLALVTPVIVIEGAPVGAAIARSWRLSRGRFWTILGVLLIVQLVFATIGQVVSVPFSIATSLWAGITTPTQNAPAGIAVIAAAVLTQAVVLLVQAIGLVVLGTATALLYLDVRMRREALDLDLMEAVDRRHAGLPDGPDPYRRHIGRVIVPDPPAAPGPPQPPVAPPDPMP